MAYELLQVGHTYQQPPRTFNIEATTDTIATELAALPVNIPSGSKAYWQEPAATGTSTTLHRYRFRRTSEDPANGTWNEITNANYDF